MATPRDTNSVVEIPGPWQHRYVAANGARFHVAEVVPERTAAEPGLVLFLHGFPEFWWAWRHQLPPTAAAGFRAVAMDLRGYGGSDKTPRGYDPVTLSGDVAGVVKALGHRSAVVVGQGWGGYVGWAAAALHSREVSALCAVSAPHPAVMLEALRSRKPTGALTHLARMQVPWFPERRLADPARGYVRHQLDAWSAPGSAFPTPEAARAYEEALALWPASHCALEYHRWLFRSRVRSDGRRFAAAMTPAITQPVCCLYGDQDPVLSPGSHERSRSKVAGPFTAHPVPATGHFPHEESPRVFNDLLLAWLRSL